MKKIIYLSLFTLIFSLFGINFVNAATVVPSYNSKIDDFTLYRNSPTSFSRYSGGCILVYETNGVMSDYELLYSNSNLGIFIIGADDILYDPTLQSPSFTNLFNQTVYSNNSYTFNFSTSYKYLYITNNGGCISSSDLQFQGTLPPEPEPEPDPLTFADLIYVPEDSTYNKCYVVQSEGVIRGYDIIPALSTNYNYRDYYIKSSYIYKDGSGSWSQYSTLPICLDSEKLTNDFYYRLDFDKICIIFITLVLFGILLPIKIFSKILLGKGGL